MQILINNVQITQIPYSECRGVFDANIAPDKGNKIDRYPFPIILLHKSLENDSKVIFVHIAYIDRDLNCR